MENVSNAAPCSAATGHQWNWKWTLYLKRLKMDMHKNSTHASFFARQVIQKIGFSLTVSRALQKYPSNFYVGIIARSRLSRSFFWASAEHREEIYKFSYTTLLQSVRFHFWISALTLFEYPHLFLHYDFGVSETFPIFRLLRHDCDFPPWYPCCSKSLLNQNQLSVVLLSFVSSRPVDVI